MARFSTGLRNAVASQSGLGLLMNRGVIRLYGNDAPSTPDNPPGASAVGVITTSGLTFIPGDDPNSAGLLLRLVSPGGLANDGVWRLKGLSVGTARWWRWYWRWGDPDTLSTYYPRVDGAVGTELKLVSTALTATTDVEVQQFLFLLPMGA